MRHPRPRFPTLVATLAIALATTLASGAPAARADDARAAPSPEITTAWQRGSLDVDTAGLLSRSDIVLETAPWRTDQAMPLGNGTLGAAVWAADGYTAQLNRGDTFPDLRSAGHLRIPGLHDLVAADDFSGRFAMHDAELALEGGGMRATSYIDANSDQMIVEVTGARPDHEQKVELALWEGRNPTARADRGVASLAETWTDEENGQKFGQLAAVTADGRDVAAKVVDGRSVEVTFRPRPDGSFRVVVGVPSFNGDRQDSEAARAVRQTPHQLQRHHQWWHDYWSRATPMRLDSTDGKARYFEALRVQQLYMSAASMRGDVPASHGGVTSLFSPYRDDIHWSPSNWWHFNLRQPVWVNLGANTAELNRPYLDLYLDRTEQMRSWTRQQWPEAQGICVPEFLRYDGTAEAACSSSMEPDWLNRVLSTGPEVVQNILLQAAYTGDKSLQRRAYPLIKGVMEFYLSVLEEGPDGLLHLHHVNSLEVQWDTSDPTPDIAAMRTIFPVAAELADDNGDRALAGKLRAAHAKLPSLPTTTRNGAEVIAWSATDEAARNTQNPDLEAVWPWRAIDPDSQLAQDTFTNRVYLQTREWASDPQWAAWLGRSEDVRSLLELGTTDFQAFSNGFGAHTPKHDPLRGGGFYEGWNAVVASTLQDSLVQERNGVVTVGRGWPASWQGTGAVMVPGGHRVSVEVSQGSPTLIGIQAGSRGPLSITNPWPGSRVEALDERGNVVASTSEKVLNLDLAKGKSVVLQRADRPVESFTHARLGGERTDSVMKLGNRMYGVETSTPQEISETVEVASPYKLHQLVAPAPGNQVYVDRAYRLTDVPPELDGTVMVRGANNDGKVVQDDYLTLDVKSGTTVWVAFDGRGEGTWWPDWLLDGSWTRTGGIVGTEDRPLILFAKEVPAGQLALGGNSGTRDQGGSSYVTFVKE